MANTEMVLGRVGSVRGARTRRLSALACAGVLVGFGGWGGGCTSYAPPTLRVTGVSIGEETGEGVVVRYHLDASNENTEALPLREVRYVLELNGKRVFEGTRSPECTLRRLGSQPVTLPAAIALTAQGGDGGGVGGGGGGGGARPRGRQAYRLTGTLVYETPGALAEILFDSGVRRPDTGFSAAGTIDFGNPGDQPVIVEGDGAGRDETPPTPPGPAAG